MDSSSAGDWLALAERLSGWFFAGAGILIAARRRVAALFRAVRVAHDIHTEFGREAAATLREITEDLKRSQTVASFRHRLAERHLRVGIYLCGVDGRCTWVNDWLSQAFGIDRSDCVGFGWLGAIADAERSNTHSKWINAVTTGIPYRDKYTVRNKRNGRSWVAKTEAFAITRDDQVVCFLGVVEPADQSQDSDPGKPPSKVN